MSKRVLFIVNMDDKNKGGLFNATHQRIKNISGHLEKFQVYSLYYYDGYIISLIKKILKRPVYPKKSPMFQYDGVTYEYIHLKTSLLQKVFPNLMLTIFFLGYILFNRKKFREFNLISAHWGYPQGYFSYCLYKVLSIPYTITLHGSDIHTIPSQDKVIKNLTLRALRNSSHNFFVSNHLQSAAQKLGYEEQNYSILYNGVDTSLFNNFIGRREKQEKKNSLGLEGKVVGFIGSLIELKRADKLGTIFNYIKSGIEEKVSFLIIGDGELYDHLKKELDLTKIPYITTGKIPPNEIPSYINMMDILILPSRKEGFGNVVIEANACGVLAIGSDNGGIPEALGDVSYIVNDGKDFEKQLAIKVIEFLKKGYNQETLVDRVYKNFHPEKLSLLELERYNTIIKKGK